MLRCTDADTHTLGPTCSTNTTTTKTNELSKHVFKALVCARYLFSRGWFRFNPKLQQRQQPHYIVTTSYQTVTFWEDVKQEASPKPRDEHGFSCWQQGGRLTSHPRVINAPREAASSAGESLKRRTTHGNTWSPNKCQWAEPGHRSSMRKMPRVIRRSESASRLKNHWWWRKLRPRCKTFIINTTHWGCGSQIKANMSILR